MLGGESDEPATKWRWLRKKPRFFLNANFEIGTISKGKRKYSYIYTILLHRCKNKIFHTPVVTPKNAGW